MDENLMCKGILEDVKNIMDLDLEIRASQKRYWVIIPHPMSNEEKVKTLIFKKFKVGSDWISPFEIEVQLLTKREKKKIEQERQPKKSNYWRKRNF